MNVNGFFDKFPDEIREFDFDASSLLINGDTLASAQVDSLSSGFNIDSSRIAGSLITLRVSGGQPGNVAYALAKATLGSGQLREALLAVLIKPLPSVT